MRKLILSLCIVLFISCEKQVEFVPVPQRPIPVGYMSTKENAMVNYTNAHRTSLGLPVYKTSLELYYLALAKSYEMKEADSLSHAGFWQRYLDSKAIHFGESISCYFTNPESNINAFFNSPPHYSMFVSPIYEYIAIADVDNWCCVLVARYRPYNVNYPKWEYTTTIISENLISPLEIKK